MRNFSVQCSANSHVIYEESNNFFINWTASDQWNPEKFLADEGTDFQSWTEYQYMSASELNNIITTGLTDFFSGGGYVVKLIGPVTTVQEKLTSLQKQGWIDGRTRAVMIEFTVYDANINVFSVNKIVSEFPPYGSVISWAMFQPLRLLPFGNQYVSLEIVCLVAFSIFGFIFIVREIVSFFRDGFISYFSQFWTYINLLVVVFTTVGIVSYILRFIETQGCLRILEQTHGNTIVSFQYAQLLDFSYNLGLSFCVFATMLKLITLLRFNRRISVLQSTLARCKKDLINYFVVFGILFAAFSQRIGFSGSLVQALCYDEPVIYKNYRLKIQFLISLHAFFFILNTKLTDYKNFVTAACSIFTVLLGKGQFDVLLASSPLIPALFVAFFVSMVIFMVNIFITIILTAFIEIKHDSARQNNEYEVVQFMIRKFRAMMGLRPTPEQKFFCEKERESSATLTNMERKMCEIERRMNEVVFHPRRPFISN